MRWIDLVGVVLALCAVGVVEAAGPGHTGNKSGDVRPLVGAIRWDAWCGDRGVASEAVQHSLGPDRWHYRLPSFGEVIGTDHVRIDGTPQAVVDREIELAVDAGLDYWAFVTYPANDALSLVLKRYLSSSKRMKLRFCLITECSRWRQKAFEDRVLRLLEEPGYQTVMGRRPLLYVGFIDQRDLDQWPDGIKGVRGVLDRLRAGAIGKGLGKPYVVIMDFDPAKAKRWAEALDGDAISCYAITTDGKTVPYAQLARKAEAFWDRCKDTGLQVVPVVTTGWDRRPRIERPVPWEPWQKPGVGLDNYSLAPKPAEIADHLRNALGWLSDHRPNAQAQASIIYAWNEYDEGGWLAPTRGEGTARLDAIAKILRHPGTPAGVGDSQPAVPPQR